MWDYLGLSSSEHFFVFYFMRISTELLQIVFLLATQLPILSVKKSRHWTWQCFSISNVNLLNNTNPFSSNNNQTPIFLTRCAILCQPPFRLGFYLAWSFEALVYVDTVTGISYVHLPCCALRMLFLYATIPTASYSFSTLSYKRSLRSEERGWSRHPI